MRCCSRRRCRLLVAGGGSLRLRGSPKNPRLGAEVLNWRRAAFFIASPHPLSMSFGIGDFEGHRKGRFRSAVPPVRRRRLAETPTLHPASGWRVCGSSLRTRDLQFEEAVRGRAVGGAIYSLRKQFEDEGSALPLGSRSLSVWQLIKSSFCDRVGSEIHSLLMVCVVVRAEGAVCG